MVAEDGQFQLNKNVVNGSEPFLRLIGDLPSGTPVAFEAAFGWDWLAELLEDYGFEAQLVHPLRCKAIASARPKNDKGRHCHHAGVDHTVRGRVAAAIRTRIGSALVTTYGRRSRARSRSVIMCAAPSSEVTTPASR